MPVSSRFSLRPWRVWCPALLWRVGALLIGGALTASGQGGLRVDARAHRTAERIVLDGRLDEAVWQQAEPITDFRQRDPQEGAPSTQRTVVRLLSTPAGLAVGWWCYDTEAGRIVRSQLRRDAELRTDDYVSMGIDGLHDRRSAFYFRSNANGALWDGEHLDTERGNEGWDGVWDARTSVTTEGYFVEMLIPWATLRYADGDSVMVMNFRRFIPRTNEETLWRAWKRTEGFRFLDRAGLVGGLAELPPRPTLEARPYVAGDAAIPERVYFARGGDSVLAPAARNASMGLDLKVPITNTLTADVALNPDFAQVEVDRQLVNLTRFPLFFPEQRPFFTEGQAIFDFGRQQYSQMFYSRRIGLGATGTPVAIPLGVRVQGRAGAHQLGVVAVRTGGAEDATDAVVRVKRDLLGRGYLGAMATYADTRVRPGNVAAGVDLLLPYRVFRDQNLVIDGNVAWNQDSTGGASGTHTRVGIDFPNDRADLVVRYDRIESGYRPALGFIQQRGVQRLGGNMQVMWRPPRRGMVRRYEVNFFTYDFIWRLGGGIDNASYGIRPLGLQFQRGGRFDLTLRQRLDNPGTTFGIFPGVGIPSGSYRWNRVEAQYAGAEPDAVKVTVNASTGGFYDGRSTDVSGSVRVRRSPHMLATVDLSRSAVVLPQGRFTATAVRLRGDYAFNPRLNATLFAQWDNQSNRASTNARVRWTVTPGSDLYVVWNSGWPTGLERPIPWLRPSRGGLVAKYVYFFRQ